MALDDVALVVLIDVLAKKVNENNNQILREYCAFETPSIIMDDVLRNEKCRKKNENLPKETIGPRPLHGNDHTKTK